MVRAAASTCCMSAAPSSSGGVPTAMKRMVPKRTPSCTSVVKCSRPPATLRSTISFRPGSKIGSSPCIRRAILPASVSMHCTSLPISAKQAPVTRPT
jgi:hypothetical protein